MKSSRNYAKSCNACLVFIFSLHFWSLCGGAHGDGLTFTFTEKFRLPSVVITTRSVGPYRTFRAHRFLKNPHLSFGSVHNHPQLVFDGIIWLINTESIKSTLLCHPLRDRDTVKSQKKVALREMYLQTQFRRISIALQDGIQAPLTPSIRTRKRSRIMLSLRLATSGQRPVEKNVQISRRARGP